MAAVVPDLLSTTEASKELEAEIAYWRDHCADLLERYPDQFVAVSRGDQDVVAARPSLSTLLDDLEAGDADLRDLWLRFIATKPRRLRR